MLRSERHIIVDSQALNELTFKAKNLYNVANYQIRQKFIFTGLMQSEYELTTFFANINQPDYRALPAQTSQQVIKLLFKNWTSYFAAIREWISRKSFCAQKLLREKEPIKVSRYAENTKL